MEHILTIDAGTSAFKIILWNENGEEKESYAEELTLQTDERGFVEFPVEDYWEVTRRGIKQILHASAINPRDIRVVVISSQGETLINLDREGRPLRNAIVWIDNRSTEEARLIEEEFGREAVFQIAGQPEVVPTWPATKILWQKREEPEIFQQTSKFLLPEDYLLYKLTGKFVGEYSVHSSSLWLDINRRCLWKEMTEFLGVKQHQFPEIVGSGEAIGSISKQASQQTGLTENTVVVTGALDQAAGAIGAGSVEAGVCSETTGSALAACVLVDKPVINVEHRVPCHCHGLADKYYLLAWGQTAGMSLKWFKDNFCREEIVEAQKQKRSVYEVLTEAASNVSPGSEGLVFLPHLTGAACPEFNPYARGVFFGISLNHKKAHFVRSIMESVAYMLKKNIDLLEKMGLAVEEVRSVGGGSRSQLWNQIKSDVLQKPLRRVLVSEAASVGGGYDSWSSDRDVQRYRRRMWQNGEPGRENTTGLGKPASIPGRLPEVYTTL